MASNEGPARAGPTASPAEGAVARKSFEFFEGDATLQVRAYKGNSVGPLGK